MIHIIWGGLYKFQIVDPLLLLVTIKLNTTIQGSELLFILIFMQ